MADFTYDHIHLRSPDPEATFQATASRCATVILKTAATPSSARFQDSLLAKSPSINSTPSFRNCSARWGLRTRAQAVRFAAVNCRRTSPPATPAPVTRMRSDAFDIDAALSDNWKSISQW